MMESESTSPGNKEMCGDMQQHLGREGCKDFIPDLPSSPIQCGARSLSAPFHLSPMCHIKSAVSVFSVSSPSCLPPPLSFLPLSGKPSPHPTLTPSNMAASTFAPAVTFTHDNRKDFSGKCF